MKIIRPFLPVYRGECGHCGCRIECDPSEVKRTTEPAAEWVTCPNCSRNLNVAPFDPKATVSI